MTGFFHWDNDFNVACISTLLLLIATICHFTDTPHFVYSFFSWWTFGLFLPLVIINNVPINMYIYTYLSTVFNSFRYIPRSGNAGSYRNFMFNFFRNWQTIFQSGCTIFHSHYQYIRFQLLHIPSNTLVIRGKHTHTHTHTHKQIKQTINTIPLWQMLKDMAWLLHLNSEWEIKHLAFNCISW